MRLNIAKKSIIGGFIFRKSPKWFHLAHKAIFRFKPRSLLAKIAGIPAQRIAEKSGHFIVEIVASSQHAKTLIHGHLIKIVTLDRTAGRADGTPQGLFNARNSQMLTGQILDQQRKMLFVAKIFHGLASQP